MAQSALRGVVAALLLCALPAVPTTGASANYTWEIRNASAVYGGAYELPTVWLYGMTATAAACQAACAANATCQTFDYAYETREGTGKCGFLKQCWFRSDTVYDTKQGDKCIKQSGHKIAPSPPPPKPPANAKNVLLIMFDDYRIMHRAWGFLQPSVPNADALAAKSLIFDRAYCQQAVCGPSRASLLSGRRPDSTQMWNFIGGFRQTPGADKWRTFPEYFKSKGYYVAGCGKLFHPDDPANFDAPRSWTDPIDNSGKWPYFGQGSCPFKPQGTHGCAVPPGKYPDVKYPDVEALNVAKQFLATAKNDSRPFWIGVGFVKPHMPHVFPEKFYNQVPPLANITVAKNPYNPKGTNPIEWGSGAEGPSSWEQPPAKEVAQDWRRAYYAAASFSDSLLGELLAELEATGKANDTIIALTADHGWGLGEHNHWIKYTNWETDARVPLMVHVPWYPQTAGKHTKAIVEHVDLYPTLAELAGIPVDKTEESIEGDSYAALFPGTNKTANASFQVAFTQYPRCCRKGVCDDFVEDVRCASVSKYNFSYMGYSMRVPSWRYTEWALWDKTALKPIWNTTVLNDLVELYDHRADNGSTPATFDSFENENVATAFPSVVAALSSQLRAFFDKNGP